MKKIYLSILVALSVALFSCSSEDKSNAPEAESDQPSPEAKKEMPKAQVDPIVMEKDGITLTELASSPKFPNASLKLQEKPSQDDNGKTHFKFDVNDYELAVQTKDAEGKCCANSDQGQHIHLILNNGPYTAHYEKAFTQELENDYYVGLAFLSRSYHESIKNGRAHQVFDFVIGPDEGGEKADLSQPMLFYSRPKGEYQPADCDQVLLDFFVSNAKISPADYTIRATINGTAFVIEKWVPFVMEGLPRGENTVKIELLDKEGNVVPGDFGTIERTVTLLEE